MKKTIVVGITIFLCIITLAIIATVLITNKCITQKDSNRILQIYNKYPSDVDEAVNVFMRSEEYNKMSKDKQLNAIGDLLNLYEEKNIIKNLYYDEFGPSYTFTYNYGDIKGALGGVLLKEWDPMMN